MLLISNACVLHCDVDILIQIGGIYPENCRVLKTDSSTNYSLSPDVLAEAISHDLAIGLIPFFLCATVGDSVAFTYFF